MAALPGTFPEVRIALEKLVASDDAKGAARLVERLEEKARVTRSRELNALAWFAKGLTEDGEGRHRDAEQSLLVSVSIGRELFKEDLDALGHAARSLGFVYTRLDRPDSAAEMFLLARNVFLKTQPALAPEVVRLRPAATSPSSCPSRRWRLSIKSSVRRTSSRPRARRMSSSSTWSGHAHSKSRESRHKR